MTARKTTLSLTLALALVATGSVAAHAQVVAITDATVHTEPGKVLQGATVLIRDGVVRAVGKTVAIPTGARVIKAENKVVTAGLVAASSRLGLSEVSLESSTREGRLPGGKGADVIFAAYRAEDGYNATSVAIPVARAQGVTSAVVAPVGGLISGTSAWVSLADGLSPDVQVASPLAMYAAMGLAAYGSAQGSRGLGLLRLREVLDDARVYARQKRAYERNQSRSMAASRLDLEALQPVLGRRIPLVLRAHRSSDILAGIRLARDSNVRVLFHGATEAWMVAKQLAEAGAGVILEPSANLPYNFDQIHVRDDNAHVLAEAGVPVAIAKLDSTHNVGELRQQAGIAVANGLSPERALAAITTVPASFFGVDRGTIARGKVADLVVWSGDPFELSTRAEHVFIGGVEQSLRTRQHMLLERYRTLPR